MATGSAREIGEKIRDDQLGREDRVLQDTGITLSERRVFELACELISDRGEGKG